MLASRGSAAYGLDFITRSNSHAILCVNPVWFTLIIRDKQAVLLRLPPEPGLTPCPAIPPPRLPHQIR